MTTWNSDSNSDSNSYDNLFDSTAQEGWQQLSSETVVNDSDSYNNSLEVYSDSNSSDSYDNSDQQRKREATSERQWLNSESDLYDDYLTAIAKSNPT